MLVTYFVIFRWLNDHLFGRELFIRIIAGAFRKLPSIYVLSYFPFGFEGRMWGLIVSVPDHCLSLYFATLDCFAPTVATTKEYCSICLETAFISKEFGMKILMVVAAAEE